MPTPKTASCLDTDHLRLFLAEELNEAEEVRVQAHLDQCAACRGVLERAAGEPELWAGLREHLVTDELSAAPEPTSELEELSSLLDPTDDPSMMGRIGGYEVQGLIGRGTTGLVFKALEPRLHRYVALKLMSPGYKSNGSARQRFEREARAVAAVTHEHVVPIYAVDDHRGLPYIAMQYVPGPSLEQRLEGDGPLDPTEVVRIGLQVARGLAAAHAQGIVHRDVKPANVILESSVERAMVTDFGLARVAHEGTMTRSGTITGTPNYMSPEQARGEGVDQRSDLFSLGSLLYAACTGRAPFRAETVYGVIRRVCEQEPRPIRELQPATPLWLIELIGKLMSKPREERFASAEALGEALAQELAHLQSPTLAPEPVRAWRSASRAELGQRRRWLYAGALLGAAALVAGAWALQSNGPDENGGPGSSQAAGLGLAPELRSAPQDGEPAIAWSERELVRGGRRQSVHEQRWSQSFPLAAGGALRLQLGQGDVELASHQGESAQVEVVRAVLADQRAEAEALLLQHELAFTAEDEALAIASQLPLTADAARFEQLLFRVSVPAGHDVEVLTQRGNIAVAALQANVNLRTDDGGIRCGRIAGSVWARSENGDLELHEGCEGEAELFAIHGDAYLSQASSEAFVHTSSGSIYLGASPGSVSAQSSGGHILVDGHAGPLAVHATSGDVSAQFAESPEATALLSAASGDVRVRLARSIASTVQVRGRIESELSFEVRDLQDGSRGTLLVHELNGGGEDLMLRSTGGLTAIELYDPAPSSVADRVRTPSALAGPPGPATSALAQPDPSPATASADDSSPHGSGLSQPDPAPTALGGSVDAPGVSGLGGSVDAPGTSSLGGSADAPGASGLGGSVGAPGSSALGGSADSPGASGLGGSVGAPGSSALGGSADSPGASGLGGSVDAPGTSALGGSVGAPGSSGLGGSADAPGASGLGGSVGAPGSSGLGGIADARGTSGLGGSVDAPGTSALGGSVGAPGSGGLGGSADAPGTSGLGGSVDAPGTSGPSGSIDAPGTSALGGSVGAPESSGLGGSADAPGASGLGGSADAPGTSGLGGSADAPGASGLGGSVGAPGSSGLGGIADAPGTSGLGGSVGAPGSSGLGGSADAPGASGLGGSVGAPGSSGLGGSADAPGASGLGGSVGAPGSSGLGGSADAPGASGLGGSVGAPGSSGLGGSADAPGASGLGGSVGAPSSSGLGGSGLGGSGSSGSVASASSAPERGALPQAVQARTSGEPRPGALVPVQWDEAVGNVDGYALYLPLSHGQREEPYPLLVYLQGAFGVGGPVSDLDNWGLLRLVRDESDLSIERNRLLLDEFVIVAPHIREGQYHDSPEAIRAILDEMESEYGTDPQRVLVTGLSRGGHGSWGLGAELAERVAAIAPVGGGPWHVEDKSPLIDTAIWIAHNGRDHAVAIVEVERAIAELEAMRGEEFLRSDPIAVSATDFLERPLVFTSFADGGHDAWTDLYTRPAFYRWLLRQSLARPSEH